jgi:hypothetical protein
MTNKIIFLAAAWRKRGAVHPFTNVENTDLEDSKIHYPGQGQLLQISHI